jgi:hypothetical protein
MRYCYLLLFTTFFACQKNEKPPKSVETAFYAWKTTFDPIKSELKTLQDWKIKRLYIKYADLDWQSEKGAIPVSTTDLKWHNLDTNIAIVPVFFIVNRVFSQITNEQSLVLTNRILQHIQELTPPSYNIPEIQIDCDWTASTREAYFLFLKNLKTQMDSLKTNQNVQLSATIRLHQVKYQAKTGIPPVDRGLLMLYNFDKPSDPKVKNSILNSKVAATYLNPKDTSFALPLDAALPLFAWGLHFRNLDFQGFLHDFRTTTAEESRFLTKIDKNIYRVNADTTCFSTYFRRGDWVRTEAASTDEIALVWENALPILSKGVCHLVFFDLNEQNLKNYQYEDLSKALQITD